MPPLDVRQDPIVGPLPAAGFRPIHPSPSRTGLGLERMSAKELGWWGHRFGIDTPYLAVPAGWGEWIPLYGFDAAESAQSDVREIVPVLPAGS